ncbi:hypothetical protein WMY93_022259 [Mugilogobius chulae]|uniref:Uncharacterized protein n=1 Tax=Mugilogobius chulae TaxID=88201 RepID=A0AAW0NAZ5_9GOBI
MLLLPVLLAFLASLFGGFYFLGVFRRRRPGEPPLDKGLIPWLGHAFEFQRDPCNFLWTMREKHGDFFTIQMAGRYITVLLDPFSLEAFFKQERDMLNSKTHLKKIAKTVFDYEILSPLTHKSLQGDALRNMTEQMTNNLQNFMLNNLSSTEEQGKWVKDGLFNYCKNILFRSGYLTVFGNTASKTKENSDKAKDPDRTETGILFTKFLKFEDFFPKYVSGSLSSKLQTEAQRIKRVFWDALSLDQLRNKDNLSVWILDIQHTLRQEGVSDSNIEKVMFAFLFASQSNVPSPAFWLLFYLMKDPEAMNALRREAEKVVKESGQEVCPGGPLIRLTHDMLMKTPVLDSAVEEALRLSAGIIVNRLACQDMTLKITEGRELLFRKDDLIWTVPYLAVHTDPEIHPDPHTFKYDRFLNPDGTKKKDFYKKGKRVKYYNVPWEEAWLCVPGDSSPSTSLSSLFSTCWSTSTLSCSIQTRKYHLLMSNNLDMEQPTLIEKYTFDLFTGAKKFSLLERGWIIELYKQSFLMGVCQDTGQSSTQIMALTGANCSTITIRRDLRRRPGEPPLDKGLIPWLGHAFEFKRDPLKFLQRMKEKHGDFFTIQMAGQYITVLLDPFSLEACFKQGSNMLDFENHFIHVIEAVFECYVTNPLPFKLLQGDALRNMTEQMTNHLQNFMLHNRSSMEEQGKWVKDGLYYYCKNILFGSSYLTMFGHTASQTKENSDKAKDTDRATTGVLLPEFIKFETFFPKFVSKSISSKLQTEARRIKRVFWDAFSLDKLRNKDNVSVFIQESQQTLTQEGVSDSTIEKAMFAFLWASQSNVPPPAFWLLLHLMKDPEAMNALRREAEKVVKESGQEVCPGGPLIRLTHDMLMKTPALDSAVEEALRLSAGLIMNRLACQDMTLKMTDGRELLLRKDDLIWTLPHLAVHTDPEVHPDPHTFKYDRFLNPDGTKKKDFYKKGKRVKYYTAPWGGGLPMCPGRFFAINELKQFVFHMLVYFDFELLNPDEKIPSYKVEQFGYGTQHPDREINFRTGSKA